MIPLSEVAPTPVSWLWKNFIPLGKATLLSGDPNSGKTFFSLDLCGRLSRGLLWPDGASGEGPARTIYLTIEDGAADTIRPRLDSLGGDPAQVSVLDVRREDFFDLSSEGGIGLLRSELHRIGGVKLVVLDPVLDFSGETNPNAAEQVRAFLSPLISMAESSGFALLLISHLNKKQGESALYRTSGATAAWLGKCRAGFLIFRDRNEPKKRYFTALKANLSPDDPAQLAFRIIEGRLIYEKVDEVVVPEDHLRPRESEEERFETAEIRSFLLNTIPPQGIEWKVLRGIAAENGHKKDALYAAARALKIKRNDQGFGRFKTSIWTLPDNESGEKPS
jgi:hypothetical protein